MKIKFITLTCEKYHDNRVKTIRETWAKDQNITFLSDINSGNDTVGYSYLPKGYELIWMKYIEYLKNLREFDSDWYFFTDDDTFVNVRNVEKLLEDYDSQDKICIGHIGKLNSDGTDMDGNQTGFPLNSIIGENNNLPIIYVSGGAGFILSKSSMIAISDYLKNSQDPTRCYNSDVTFGFWMRSSAIEVVDIEGFWWTNSNDLKHNDEQILSSFTYHYVNEDNMRFLHYKTSQTNNTLSDLKINNCIITQSKDQAKRLQEWILYHYEQGFDTFIFFDDYSEDNSVQVLNEIKEKWGINIIIKYSDGIGNRKSFEKMQNSNSYGGDSSINYRLIRSYNSGLNLVKQINPKAICAIIDVDEFIVSDEDRKVTDIIRECLEKDSIDLLYIHSFDIKDNWRLDKWYITESDTSLRWDFHSRSLTDFKNRGKSVCIANSIDEIYQRPNYVHQLREWNDEESEKLNFKDFNKLRIHHYRKPNLPNNTIDFVNDETLINKSLRIKEKYEV